MCHAGLCCDITLVIDLMKQEGKTSKFQGEQWLWRKGLCIFFFHEEMNTTIYREGWAMCSGWKDSEYSGKKKSSQAPTPMSPSCRSVFLNSDICLLLQVRVLYHLCPFSSKQSSILYYVFISCSYTQWMLNRWMTVW